MDYCLIYSLKRPTITVTESIRFLIYWVRTTLVRRPQLKETFSRFNLLVLKKSYTIGLYIFSVCYREVDILSLHYAPAEELLVQGSVYQSEWMFQSKDSARGQSSS